MGWAYDANSMMIGILLPSLYREIRGSRSKYEIHDSFIDEYKGNIKEILKGKDAIVL